MQLSAVLLARVFLFIESTDLNPHGKAFFPDVVRALVERYRFQKFPQKFEEFDEIKGVEFAMGRSGNTTIDKAILFAQGISLDTRASTEQSDAVLEEILTWASENLGLSYRKEMVRRKGYVSQIAFYSDVPLLSVNPVFEDYAIRIGKAVSENLQLEFRYAPNALMISLDPESQRLPSSPFSIEHRIGTGFSEGKYFSAAPLQTDVHMKLLEQYEQTIAAQHKRSRGMAKFEYQTGSDQVPQTMEADDYDLDVGSGKLTFFDKDRKAIATFKITSGAHVRRLDRAS